MMVLWWTHSQKRCHCGCKLMELTTRVFAQLSNLSMDDYRWPFRVTNESNQLQAIVHKWWDLKTVDTFKGLIHNKCSNSYEIHIDEVGKIKTANEKHLTDKTNFMRSISFIQISQLHTKIGTVHFSDRNCNVSLTIFI